MMNMQVPAKHKNARSKMSQRHLFSLMVLAVVALSLMLGCMSVVAWVLEGQWLMGLPDTITITAGFLLFGFALSIIALMRASKTLIWNMRAKVVALWLSVAIISLIILLIFRLPYSTIFFWMNWITGFIFLLLFFEVAKQFSVIQIGTFSKTDILDEHNVKQKILLNTDEPASLDIDMIVATHEQMRDEHFVNIFADAAVNKISIVQLDAFIENITGRADLSNPDSIWLMHFELPRHYVVMKRLLDIILALIGITIFMPIMIFLYVIIQMESAGSPIFVQQRVGKGERIFNMYKFRSMVASAETTGAKFATKNDKRITKIGYFIRKWRLDELPQFFNVLQGSMSIIGPRPEQQAFVDELSAAIPLYRVRHVIAPGITGWAQVMQGYADDISSTDIKLSYDLFYIKNLSLMLDFMIIFKTFKTIITGFGSR